MTSRREPDFKELETFVAVADEGSFTAAARRLGTNQPTVSGRIASLETLLGVRVFDRGPRQAELTPAGHALLPTARHVLRGREELLRTVSRLSEIPVGELVIAASTIPGAYLLPTSLSSLRARAPQVRVKMLVGDSRQTLATLRAGTALLAVVGQRPDDDSLSTQPIGKDAVVLVATPEFAAARRLQATDATLRDVPVVLRETGSATRQAALDALGRTGTVLSPSQIVLEVQGNDALREAARVGMGLAFVSRLVVQRDLDDGALVSLDTLMPPIEREFLLVTRRGRTLSRAGETLIELLTAG